MKKTETKEDGWIDGEKIPVNAKDKTSPVGYYETKEGGFFKGAFLMVTMEVEDKYYPVFEGNDKG